MSTLKVTIVQPTLDDWTTKTNHFAKITDLLSSSGPAGEINSSNTDLLILPEMYSTGPTIDVSHAEDITNLDRTDPSSFPTSFKQLHNWQDQKEFSVGIIGGAFTKKNTNTGGGDPVWEYRNHLGWINSDGGGSVLGIPKDTSTSRESSGEILLEPYAKRHLTPYPVSGSNERNSLTKGDEIRQYRYNNSLSGIPDFRFRVAIGYDILYPGWLRNREGNSPTHNYFHILILIGAWPESLGGTRWDQLLRVRAMENQAFVIGVNSFKTGSNALVGRSQVVNPAGEVVSSVLTGADKVGNFSIDLSTISSIRSAHPFLSDRDLFNITN